MAKRRKSTSRRIDNKGSLVQPLLPDTDLWQPRKTKAETLQSAFLKRCIATEQLIRLRAQFESQMNIDNFDSGPGLEDIVREEFRSLCPTRYSIKAGVVNDSEGKTAGDFDLIIFNEIWFPTVKAGATAESRRFHFPVDGIYAVGEIKQTLDFDTLDQAMQKLVTCHRLKRHRTHAYRLVENREGSPCTHGLKNPLYSFILASDLKSNIDFDKIVERFFFINQSLKRLEVVRALCVLGHGTVVWGYLDQQKKEVKPALFMLEDLYEPVIPMYHKAPNVGSVLYIFLVNLFLHLYQSVLAPEDIVVHYGAEKPDVMPVSLPKSPDIALQPDIEWLETLKVICKAEHDW